ncbi:MAG: hypothetical protein AAGI48_02320 [Verrucomicrobiota bacterium]
MFESSPFDRVRGPLCGLGLIAFTLPASFGQGLSLRVTDSEVPGLDTFFGGDFLPDFKGGIYSGVSMDTYYDSNLFLSQDYPDSDAYLEFAPWIAYRSDPDGNARNAIEVLYSPLARIFWDNSDLNSFDNAGSISYRFRGAKTDFLAYVSYAEVSGPDRLAGGFIEGDIFTYGAKASYQIAPKTRLVASYRASQSDYDTVGRAGTDNYVGDFGFEWDAGRKFSWGATVRYSELESITTGTREAWAILGNVAYNVTDRIDFSGSLGVEFAEDSRVGGGSDTGLLGKMKLTYRIDDRWRFHALARYVTVPSPGNVNYLVDDLLFSVGVTRQLNRGQLEAGVAYSISSYEASGIAAPLADDKEENLSVYLAYTRPVFNERMDFNSRIEYITNSGLRDWDQLLLSLGLTTEF